MRAARHLSGVGCGALLRHYLEEYGLEVSSVAVAAGVDPLWANDLVEGNLSPEECCPEKVSVFARAIGWPIELWPIKPWENVCTYW
ncbi:MAG: hypothetical protein A2782_01400 [Candidatus Blackburnbacteria bacterium RIFCSPHIGHO2_01_FULL_43_15b]|uniref:HTH cro/C1-type domain-containing protein n=1 Tax=Candidatus Blackburnbacteria bacterium RIFCSPHIGHO2_01_FULL_43_15b TaxID=1797513 RepID=A0A1G1UXF6_9BACT|nr:MAG: hypothetical protein A2782_01400 [Candidatus Blackburnbacteria bacterium RIFCSPHIGHO2_01_FULL_43_15b]